MEQPKNENEEDFEIVDNLSEEEKEQIRQMIINAFSETYTVEEALYKAYQDKFVKKESFRVTKKNCKTVKKHVAGSIVRLELMKLESKCLKLYTELVNNGRQDLIEGIIEELYRVQGELINLHVLLRVLNKTINVLNRHNASECNMQLSELIQYIYTKENILLSSLNEYLDKCKLATKGISYMGTNKKLPSKNIDSRILQKGIFADIVEKLGIDDVLERITDNSDFNYWFISATDEQKEIFYRWLNWIKEK